MKPRASIQGRITLALGAIALTVFSSVAILLYLTLERELFRQETENIAGKLDIALHFASEAESASSLPDLFHKLDDMLLGQGDMRLWIIDRDGKVLYGGTNAPAALETEQGLAVFRREDGLKLVGMRKRIDSGFGLEGAEAIIAKDPRQRVQLLEIYRVSLLLVCGPGILLVAGLGAWVTRRGLAPIAKLSAAAAKVAPDTFSVRLPAAGIEKELLSLVAAFNQVLDRLELAYQQMESFNADVAHELRTPLAILINGTQVALASERPAGELRELLGSNLEELEQMKGLVNDMLFLARADRGEELPERRVTSLAAEGAKVVEYFEAALEEKGVTLVIDGDCSVVCSPSLVRRAMVNLVSNAVKHTAPRQSIVLEVTASGDYATIAAKNPGMEPSQEVLVRMFDRFYSADRGRAWSEESHGLGLAIVRAIARMHGGTTFAEWSRGVTTIGMTLRAR